MPVRITCTISFSTDDEPTAGGVYLDGFDDRYKRVVRTGSLGDSKLAVYGEQYDEFKTFEEEEEEDNQLDDLATFFGSCSLHGPNHIFVEGKKFGVRQGLWAVVFLLAVSMFMVQVVDRVIYYLQYDHITMLDEWEAKEMIFPAITFCNYNTFRRSQISYSDLLFMGQLLGYEESMAPGIPLAPEPDRQGNRFSLAEFFNRTRHRIEDMLLDCKFRGQECGPEFFREALHVEDICDWFPCETEVSNF
ncbi:acid-sensing ion channel 1-like [Arapaima gigas]